VAQTLFMTFCIGSCKHQGAISFAQALQNSNYLPELARVAFGLLKAERI